MAEQFAGLSLGVDVSQVDRGKQSLNDFATAADNAAMATDDFSKSEFVAKQRARDAADAIRFQREEFDKIRGRIDPVSTALKRLTADAAALDKAWEKGIVNDDDFFKLSSLIDAQQQKLVASRNSLTEEGRALNQRTRDLETQTNRGQAYIKSLQSQADALGKTESELMAIKAAQLGVTAQAAPFIAKMKEQEAVMRKGSISAGQYKQAMAQLPAQMTDVFTSLASGMPVWLVAIQQGGQIKDSFGSIEDALKAVSSIATPARIAMAGIAATLGVMGYAAYSAYDANKQLLQSITLTGKYAANSVAELDALAQQIVKNTDTTVGEARSLVGFLASTGKVTSAQMKIIANTSAAWAAATSKDAKEVAAAFDKISGDPVKGLAELNKQFNFLEPGQLKMIERIRKTKGVTEATTQAMTIFADVMEKRIATLEDAASPLENMWDNIKKWSSRAWDEVSQGFLAGTNLIVDVIAGTVEQITVILNKGDILIGNFVISSIKALQSIPGASGAFSGVMSEQEKIVKKAVADNEILIKSYKERDERIKKGEAGYRALAQAERDSGKKYDSKSKDAVAQELKDIEKLRNARKDQRDAGTGIETQLQTEVVALQAQLAVLKEHTSLNDKISQQRKTLWNEEARIQVLKSEALTRNLTKEEKSILLNEQKILQYARQKADLGDQIVQQETANKLIDDSLKSQMTMRAKIAALNDTKGMAPKEAEMYQARLEMEADWLNKGGQLTDEAYQKKLAAADEYYAAMKEKDKDWLSGAQAALAEFGEKANDAYGNMKQVGTAALDGLSDVMTDFLMTGEADFASFANSIIKMIIKMIMQMLIFNSISGAMNMFGGGGGASSAVAAIASKGHANGGYTGSGGKYEPAGIVHRGEFVMTKEATSRIGVGNLNKLMRGYANGGAVGNITSSSTGNGGGGGTNINVGDISINGTGQGNQQSPEAQAKGVKAIVTDMLAKSCSQGGQIYNYINGT